jgi:hypothetical protein
MQTTIALEKRIPRVARSQKNQKTEVVRVDVSPPNAMPSKRKKNKSNRKPKIRSANALRSLYRINMMRPDLTGPFRQPRFGGSDRTGLTMDITEGQVVYSATNAVTGLQASSLYTGIAGYNYGTTSVVTNIGTGATIAPATQFPQPSQIADCNMTGCTIICYYIGNPLTVAGEVIVGCTIPVLSTATYNSLYAYPGTLKFPTAKLIESPIAISFRKLSPASDEFQVVNSTMADVDLPFIFAASLPTGGAINCVIYRTYEYRSTTAAGSVVPYERVGDSHSMNVMAYQDARADVADLPSPVSAADNYSTIGGWMNVGSLQILGLTAAASTVAGIHSLSKSHVDRLRLGDNRGVSRYYDV